MGDFVRTNSEAIIGIKLKKTPSEDFSKGVAISAGFHPDKDTHIETFRFGKGQNMMGMLTTDMPAINVKAGLFSWLINFIKHPIRNISHLFPVKWSEKAVFLLVMQPIDNYLKFVHERKWWRFGLSSINTKNTSKFLEKCLSNLSPKSFLLSNKIPIFSF